MIKVNVLTNNTSWYKYIKNPNNYISKKINKVCKKKQPENFKTKFDNLWIHGLIHLFGFNHKTEKDYLEMRAIEKKYLNYING